MPEVSIVMPSYNHGAFVGEAIESVLAQTSTDWELLVIDDASQDNSPEVIRAYQARDERIRAVFHETNQRTASCVNEGFALSRGRRLMILTSDDVIPPERLAHQEAVAQIPGNENKVIVGRWVDMDSQGQVLDNPYYGSTWNGYTLQRHGDIFESLVLAGVTYISMQTLLFARDHLAEVDFDERFPLIANEYKFVLDLAARYSFHEMDEVVFIHRIHGDNQCCHWDTMHEWHEKALVGRDLLAWYAHRLSPVAQTRLLEGILYDCLCNRDMPALRRYFLQFLTLHPSLHRSTLEHYRHHREAEVHFPCAAMEGLPEFSLAETGVTLADLEALS